MFVRFMDMHSGGSLKEDQQYIYIEADSEDEAKVIFYNRFGHSPDRVTCTCCGEDYSVCSDETLAEATTYDRGCKSVKIDDRWVSVEEWCGESYRPHLTVEQYAATKDVLVIYAEDIEDEERV